MAADKAPTLKCRILLAEDNPDNQHLIALLLRRAGADVVAIENGREVVEYVFDDKESERSFDVILMDMQMPLMDGYEATRKLRELGYGGPIIALTANAMKEDRQRCLDAGCDDYLPKPVDQAAMLQVIAKYACMGERSEISDCTIPEHSA